MCIDENGSSACSRKLARAGMFFKAPWRYTPSNSKEGSTAFSSDHNSCNLSVEAAVNIENFLPCDLKPLEYCTGELETYVEIGHHPLCWIPPRLAWCHSTCAEEIEIILQIQRDKAEFHRKVCQTVVWSSITVQEENWPTYLPKDHGLSKLNGAQ